jgi:hypothetical protein
LTKSQKTSKPRSLQKATKVAKTGKAIGWLKATTVSKKLSQNPLVSEKT